MHKLNGHPVEEISTTTEVLQLLELAKEMRPAMPLPEVELVHESLAAKLAGEGPLAGVLLHPVAVLVQH